MHISEVLNHLRSRSLSARERGARFEKLIRSWLLADPVYSGILANVWLWADFPAKVQFGGDDLGIDLVARAHSGEYWAIQCKFYGEKTGIDKKAVDSFISNSGRRFVDPATGAETGFAQRYWISTSDLFNANAGEMARNQAIPFHRLTLENLAQANVDWEALYFGKPHKPLKKKLYEHQREALEKSEAYFASHDRGKLIMACGTGKSYVSLLVAEKLARKSVLVLVPSIALVNQMLNAWLPDASRKIRAICVCSDLKASRVKDESDFSDDPAGLILPATTKPEEVARRFLAYEKERAEAGGDGLVAVFSTYQSIDAVAEAQKAISRASGAPHVFDLIVCDEAHRTTGISKPGEGKSDFRKIHDADFIRGEKRLYMTATPRLFSDNVKARLKQSDYELCSMDDKALYGEEIYRVGFGYAVANGLLTDYKVLVLTVGSEWQLPPDLREKVHDPENRELDFSVSSKLVGCVNGLAKNTAGEDNLLWDEDPRIMRRAIAFCANIDKKGDPASSTNTARIFPEIALALAREEEGRKIRVEARHIDGMMDAAKRADALMWLAEDIRDPEECRVLCNVRCLSEGIDAPSLDAAIFLSPRNSQVDVVQSVGRVMRNFRKGKADEKKFGYIIIPIVVNPHVSPEEALNDNQTFSVLWSILNALRAHDERFNAMINSIALNREKPKKVVAAHAPFYGQPGEGGEGDAEALENGLQRQLALLEDVDSRLYAKMVEKVGSRLYWERWARNIAPLARGLIARITELAAMPGDLADAFAQFVKSLQAAINDAIDERQAIEMLGQHMITRPVFEALFADYQFEENNAVTRAMKAMSEKLLAHGLGKDTALLDQFYASVKRSVGEVKTLSGRQTVIKNLYDSFFKGAFPKAVEQLGIVYTPVECVDFILRSADAALKREFGLGLTDRDVHILDPFTGTGTFITRLLQSGLIRREDLERKYLREIHCNEITLLAYYVADVNIESVYHDLAAKKEYQRFDGICLTDTFALAAMAQQPELYPFLRENFASIAEEQNAPVRVIIGNPPYSRGQSSTNDNAKNLEYPSLDKRIEETYVAAVNVTNKNSLYDSYIRAFRWASDRLRQNNEGGVIGFVTNSKWLDANANAGFRKCLQEEFSAIYVLDLKGAIRGKSGELARKEGGNVFDIMTGVCLVILVYNPASQGKARIYYHDIGDYLSREQKLAILAEQADIFDKKIVWTEITPDIHGDWLRQRSDLFGQFIAIGDKKDKWKETFFEPVYSLGVNTGRSAWCWNFSQSELENNVKRTIAFYNGQCEAVKAGKDINRDPKMFSWTRSAEHDVTKHKKYELDAGRFTVGEYRPFTETNLYFSRQLNEMVYQLPQLFPAADTENRVICVTGTGARKDFSCLMTNKITDLELIEKAQCFPLYYYRERNSRDLLGKESGFERHEAITDWILANIRGRFGGARIISKEMIFYYVYGVLHSPAYRARFNDDLKKELPRIPVVEKVEDFIEVAEIGRKLAALHLDYENAPHCPEVKVTGGEKGNFHVEKMKFAGKAGAWDKTKIIYNSDIEISNIPPRAYEYVVNGRSAIEWIMESYRIKIDKDSGIKNDPNAWAAEHGKPRYILDLLLSVIGLSLATQELVAKLAAISLPGAGGEKAASESGETAGE